MVTAQELRLQARNALAGKWDIAILTALLYGFLLSASTVTFIGGLILYGPLTLGLSMIFLNISRGRQIIIDRLFDGFGYFVNAFVLGLLKQIFVMLWSLLFIVPGIIKAYSYSMSFFILADNPETEGSIALQKSAEMMNGHKLRLFCLDLSFLGWALLSIFTLFIGLLWLIPYMEASHAKFYEDLKNRN